MNAIVSKVSALAFVCVAFGCQPRGFNSSDVQHGSFGATPTPTAAPSPEPTPVVDFGPRNEAVKLFAVKNHCLQQTVANLETQSGNRPISLNKTAQSDLTVTLKAGENTEKPTVIVDYNSVVRESSKGKINVFIEGSKGTTFTPENKTASWEAVVASENGSTVLNPMKSGGMKITLRRAGSALVIASLCEAIVDRSGDVTCNESKYNVISTSCR